MGKPTGFLEFARREPGYRSGEERVHDWRAVERPPMAAEMQEQAARCMDCGVPFCHGCGCPLGNVIPEWNDRVYRGRWREALDLLLETNPFPEFTGRICPALCEGSCVLGLNREPVAIRSIELAIIERGFAEGWMTPQPPSERRRERVAVIGSGPAGLAAAQALNRRGFSVTVFDAARRPGGILRYGIPEFKLEKSVVARRVSLMEAEGVRFENGVVAGEDVSIKFLQDRFHAICLAGGAREPRDLQVPGRELRGIRFAMDYLRQQNCRLDGERIPDAEQIRAEGKRVVVIGGGDTGADCLGTALRQGAASVLQIEILPEPPPTRSPDTPWPAWPLQRRDSSSHKEGGTRRWGISPKEFLGRDGGVVALRAVEVTWKIGPNGRPAMEERPGSGFEVPAELILLAMGFVGPRKGRILDDLGVQRDSRGNVTKDANNMTSVPGVFAAGDMARGASLVVRAMADGLATAGGMERYLDAVEAAHPAVGARAMVARKHVGLNVAAVGAAEEGER
ncbi:MAG: glutamate synthase subunit beta [bacterium]